MARLRSCHFNLVLYPDNPVHVNTQNILSKNGYKFAAILHDKDLLVDGTPAADHYHYVVSFTRQKDLSTLAKELELEGYEHMIEPCRNLEASLRYFCHPDNPEKYQYDPDLIFGPNKERAILLASPDKPTENDRVLLIINLLDEMDYPITFRKAVISLCKAGLYSDARRMGSLLSHIIEEINTSKMSF